MPLLAIKNLQNAFFGPVSFSIEKGQIICLMGPSGGGKSSLLRAIADLAESKGNCLLNGKDKQDMPAPVWRRKIGFVAQTPGWWAPLVRDHFVKEDLQDEPDFNLTEKMKFLNLPEKLLVQKPDSVSVGEAMRLSLLRTLQMKPQVLLLDEPTASLDEESRAKVHGLLKEAKGQGTGILWITHMRQEAKAMGDKILKMRGGVMVS